MGSFRKRWKEKCTEQNKVQINAVIFCKTKSVRQFFLIFGVCNCITQNKTKIGPHIPKDCSFHNSKRNLRDRKCPLFVHGFVINENVALARTPQLNLPNLTQTFFKALETKIS